ncbi:MAG TPA: RdgB/HAM1 family non-canonical purine NTP pyrophosphatase [Blastocatellia bacterium]|nr:RdgB/HAM1 family non-canonical purine NTP pyrophosphatase [Blastocatellia bacterium]
MRILLASTNQGKIVELSQILGRTGAEVIGLSGLATTQHIETGSTFRENALLKARYYRRASGLTTMADDSGLEVEALGGAPGLHSALYGGADASDADRINRLLAAMKDVPPEQRGARFVCEAAIAWDGGEQTFTGEAHGRILAKPRGREGFGYDPVFFYSPLGKTFAELTTTEKSEVSHRGRAFRQLADWLREGSALDTSRPSDRITIPLEIPALAPNEVKHEKRNETMCCDCDGRDRVR